MDKFIYKIAETILFEIESVKDIRYSNDDRNSFTAELTDGTKYVIRISEIIVSAAVNED